MSINYIHSQGYIGKLGTEGPNGEQPTNLLQDTANVLVLFTSADGRGSMWKLHNQFLRFHGAAVGSYDARCRRTVAGELREGENPVVFGKSVVQRFSRRLRETEKTILIVASKQNAEDEHDVEAIRHGLEVIHNWVASHPNMDTLSIALAPPAGKRGWADVGPLFAQYLDTLTVPVNVYIGQYEPEYQADGSITEFERPAKARIAAPRDLDEIENGEVLPTPGDPFIPDYVDTSESELDSDPVYNPEMIVEGTVEAVVEHELSDEEANTKAQELYDAYEAAMSHLIR